MKLKTLTYNQLQTLCWTEDNRLQAVQDNNIGSYYNYDATGERNLKLTGNTIQMTQNGQTIYVSVLDQQTLYANALVTVNDKGYTKHYFEEGKRICSKIGSGELQKINDLVEPIEGEYDNQKENQYVAIKDGNRDCIGGGWFDIEIKNLYESVVQPYESKINSGEPIFYYHSDHLGSASFLTDSSGAETQQLVYLPFGEDWVDKKYNTSQYETPYKFNGKEKDQETGYNYYGARYYYDWASIWLSVDPMSDRGPWISSYAYCFNNPVKLTDPDGNWPISAPSVFAYFKRAREMEFGGKSNEIRQLGYAMQHPINAARVGNAKDGGSNISSIAHNFAFNIQKRLGLSGGKEGDQRNAIRHTLWQAIITKEMGADHAERIGNAHEDNLDVDLSKRTFGSIDQADKAVDLLNNNIGRKIGADNKGASNKTLAGKVMETYYEQGLWTATKNGDGSASIQREKISTEQYNVAMKEISKKNNNGINN